MYSQSLYFFLNAFLNKTDVARNIPLFKEITSRYFKLNDIVLLMMEVFASQDGKY